jgi:peptide/nickel transport system substrate-binding protein
LTLPDRSARLLRFRQGELDVLSPLTPEEAAGVQAQISAGRIKVINVGPSLITELLWFNLNPQAKSVSPVRLAWFQDVRFRQAVSFAIDRQAIIDVVFSGKASPLWGPVPESSKWYNSKVKKYPHNPEQAKKLLEQLGFSDRNRDGVLEDAKGNELAFTVLTNAETPLRERIGLTIQEDLKKAGIKMTLAKLSAGALMSKINETYDYEASLFSILLGDTDPSSTRNILMSSGATHWWNPEQKTPATEWERKIDQLLGQNILAFDVKKRKEYFDEVQAIMSEQVPFVYLVARDLIVGAKSSVKNLKPGLLRDFLLWNAEELYLE